MARRIREAEPVERDATLSLMTERIASLELALEDEGWLKQGMLSKLEFSRAGLLKICQLSRVSYLKNPLIQRGVNAQVYYVFGQGMSITAKDEELNEVIQGFLGDAKNKAELTSHQARGYKEVDLQTEGNIFFVLFTDPRSGRVKVRTLPVDEVDDIITNPEDSRDNWYYKRTWGQTGLNFETGILSTKQQTAYYPDWRHRPDIKPETIGSHKVMWDAPVYHVRVGGLGRMRFGVPEVYAAIDWAVAYKDFLENWSTIVKAYARFAFKVTGLKSQGALNAVKTKLESTLATGSEKNPPPVTASTLLEPGNVKMDPVRTAGATTSADDGRRLLLMVAAVMGLPETFFGDASVGTLATAKSLDRPTELKMISRQTLWTNIHKDILDYVVARAVEANVISGTVTEEDDGTPLIDLGDTDPTIVISFPPILEHDVDAAVSAIVKAGTLDGKPLAETIDISTLTRMLLTALGEDNIDKLMEDIHPVGESIGETKLVQVLNRLEEAIGDHAERD